VDEHTREVTIALEGLEVRCRCGVTDEERREAQTLLVDVRLSPLHAHDYHDDDLAQTVDYAAVAELVANTAGQREYRLIERLATEVADRLWAAGDLRRLSVAVRKPSPPVGAPAAAACAEVVYSR
jgi:dihydroneopterin aldolase